VGASRVGGDEIESGKRGRRGEGISGTKKRTRGVMRREAMTAVRWRHVSHDGLFQRGHVRVIRDEVLGLLNEKGTVEWGRRCHKLSAGN
jgi:hypothetical protein